MATVNAGYNWVSGEVVTPAKMNSAAVPTISNIVNADVSATAAIAGTKVAPNFGSQNVLTTGTVGGSQVNVNAATTETAGVEVGLGRSGNGTSYIDLIGDSTYSGYGLRIIRENTGANAVSEIKHRGTGDLVLETQDAGAVSIKTSGTERMRVAQGGLVSIGGASNASALLTLNSTNRGFLPPVLTTTQRNNISSPAEGLMIYNSTTKKLNFYNGTSWDAVTSS